MTTLPPSDIASRMIGAWRFSRFDLDDAKTKARWVTIAPSLQHDILEEAPEAILMIGKDTIVKRLEGVDDAQNSFTVDLSASTPGALVIRMATSDEGRKRISFKDAATLRIEDLDKDDSFVTLFVRATASAPPAASAPKK